MERGVWGSVCLSVLLAWGCGDDPASGEDAGVGGRDGAPDSGRDSGRESGRESGLPPSDAGSDAGGTDLRDGDPPCVALTCAGEAQTCGALSDGCGGTLDCGACGDGAFCVSGSCASAVTVSTDAELASAIDAASADVILIAPGTYRLSDMAEGVDRTAHPLTIQALDPTDKPVFENATQSLVRTRHVTFRNLSFVNTGALGSDAIWFADAGGNGPNGDAHHITIEGCDFTSPDSGDEQATAADPDYGRGLVRLFRFSNYATHTYVIRDITASYVYQVGDFRMNGDVLIDHLVIDFWYFDGIRIIGSPDEGYVDGDRIISHVDMTNNLAVYEEIDGTGAPHPDHTQVFNTGSSANNTNPRVQNLLFYQNRFNAGQYRSNNTQSGLTQTYMVNVGYVENLWATKASPHGISLEGGASGVLIERNTMGDVNWGSRPWVRIFRADGQVLVARSFFPGGFNVRSDSNANRPGYELDAFDNDMSSGYESLFAGPPRANGIPALMTMFTPLDAATPGALDATGAFRGQAHRPMRAAAPEVSGGTGQLTVGVIHEPTLQSPDQVAAGGATYSRYDLRFRTGGAAWQVIDDVHASDVISDVDAGVVEVQTRCVNAAGEGLWSASAEVIVR